MDTLRSLLAGNEALLVFVIIGIGHLIGTIRIRGFSLGVAAVLFTGLAFGAWTEPGKPALHVSQAVIELGLILFVYAVGLTSGPGFFRAFLRHGLKYNLAVIAALAIGALVTLGGARVLGLDAGMAAGAFCGGLTNTPAMAAVSHYLHGAAPDLASNPVVGYSVTYPFGLLGGILALHALTWLSRDAFARERAAGQAARAAAAELTTQSYEVTNPDVIGHSLGELAVRDRIGVLVTRIMKRGAVSVPTKYTVLEAGDILTGFGSPPHLEAALPFFGRTSDVKLENSREHLEVLRVLVSRRDVVGKVIDELDLARRFGAQITRVRRADLEFMPTESMRIALGDRLRIVAPRERVAEVTSFFGDSERQKMDLDITALTIGISLGVLVGMLPIPIPGIGSLTLGFAGGPLLVALVLGYFGRTGPVVWTIPLEASETLRHIGLLLFLAGVGVLAGGNIVPALAADGAKVAFLGFAATLATSAACLICLRGFAGAGIVDTLGVASAMLTQPSTLEVGRRLADSDDVYVAYATSQPVAAITKIIFAQVLAIVLLRMS